MVECGASTAKALGSNTKQASMLHKEYRQLKKAASGRVLVPGETAPIICSVTKWSALKTDMQVILH